MAKTNSIACLFDGTYPPKNPLSFETCRDLYHGLSSKHQSSFVGRQSIPQAAQQCCQICRHFWMLLEKFDLKKNSPLNYDFPENHFTIIRSEAPKLNFSQLVEAKSYQMNATNVSPRIFARKAFFLPADDFRQRINFWDLLLKKRKKYAHHCLTCPFPVWLGKHTCEIAFWRSYQALFCHHPAELSQSFRQ